jgi:hypothetical protein
MWFAICPSAYLVTQNANGQPSSTALFPVSDRLPWVAECLLVVRSPNPKWFSVHVPS